MPLSTVRYVDPLSTASGTPNGSDEHPFLTVQAAFDDIHGKPAVGNAFTIWIVPTFSQSAGPLVVPLDAVGFQMSLCGIVAPSRALETPIESTGFGPAALVDSITFAAGSQNVEVTLDGVQCGPVTGIGAGETPAADVRLGAFNSNLNTVQLSNGRLLTGTTSLEGDISTIANYLYGSSPSGTAPITITSGVAGGLFCDGYTYDQLIANGATLIGPGPVVQDRQGRAVISVVVPALASGELGYANASTVGTKLAGLKLALNDQVTGSPTADLAAAGAGNGGYINCRVNADDTIRCAFIGALAGGASDFLFVKQ